MERNVLKKFPVWHLQSNTIVKKRRNKNNLTKQMFFASYCLNVNKSLSIRNGRLN